jgi:hypothetical protein
MISARPCGDKSSDNGSGGRAGHFGEIVLPSPVLPRLRERSFKYLPCGDVSEAFGAAAFKGEIKLERLTAASRGA